MYMKEGISFKVIEKTSNESFQGLWIELQFPKKRNVICVSLYRQHNSWEIQHLLQSYLHSRRLQHKSVTGQIWFQVKFDFPLFQTYYHNPKTKENTNQPTRLNQIWPVTNLLKLETCRYANDFLLLLQSYALTPVIDKPTRVHSTSATLIDNILVIQVDDFDFVLSGNVVSDISDYFSQFCLLPAYKLHSIFTYSHPSWISRFFFFFWRCFPKWPGANCMGQCRPLE